MSIKKILLLSIAALSVLGLGAQAAQAASEKADTVWGQVKIAVGSMRELGKYSAELSTQAIMGTPVMLLEKNNSGWWLVQTPDGYTGWLNQGAIAQKTPQEMHDWRRAPRLVVTDPYQIHVYSSPTASAPRDIVTDLVMGSIVEGSLASPTSGRVEVLLPDGRKGWADASALADFDQWAQQDFDHDKILDQAHALLGSSYLWGGTSTKAMDCSGLVRVAYLANGYILKRDASQQACTGKRLLGEDWKEFEPADLLFFGEGGRYRVTHVALYDRDGWIIHCAGSVKRNSLEPNDPAYVGRKVLHGVRIHGSEGSDGITQIRNHPWYF